MIVEFGALSGRLSAVCYHKTTDGVLVLALTLIELRGRLIISSLRDPTLGPYLFARLGSLRTRRSVLI